MKIRDRFRGLIIGLLTAYILSLWVVSQGVKTTLLLFGADITLSRIYLFFICVMSSIATEAMANTSAREVFVDVIFSMVISLFSVNENTLNIVDPDKYTNNLFYPALIVVLLATLFSTSIKNWMEKLLDRNVKKEE